MGENHPLVGRTVNAKEIRVWDTQRSVANDKESNFVVYCQ